jgi:hypothetical protein
MVPEAVPLRDTSAAVNPVTASENVAVNITGPDVVGSACNEPCSTETVGRVESKSTELSVAVAAVFVFVAASCAPLAGTEMVTVPLPVMLLTVTV